MNSNKLKIVNTVFKNFNLYFPYVYILLFVIFLSFLSFERKLFTYGTETDFLGSFMPEAERFLNGEKFAIEFHLPLYSIVLAIVNSFVDNWLYSGQIISIFSSFVTLLSSYIFLSVKFDRKIAIWGLLGFGASAAFIRYSMLATSDVFFLAIFTSTLAFLALADTRKKTCYWLIAGIFSGLAFLTRTNGIVLLGSVIFAVDFKNKKLFEFKILRPLLIGMFIPLSLWVSYALYSGSPIFPTSTYKLHAMAFFVESEFRNSGDGLLQGSASFTSTGEVFLKDPIYIVKAYSRDLLSKLKRLFLETNLISVPLIQLAMPGLWLLLFWKFDKFKGVLAIILSGMFLLMNFMEWEDRYYLFLIPVMGAGAGYLYLFFYSKISKTTFSKFAILVFLLISAFFAYQKIQFAIRSNSFFQCFDAFAAAKFIQKSSIPKDGIVISRKPYLGFYANRRTEYFPNVNNFSELKLELLRMLKKQGGDSKHFLFFGFGEAMYRKDIGILGTGEIKKPWLKALTNGTENGGWALYEVLIDTKKSALP